MIAFVVQDHPCRMSANLRCEFVRRRILDRPFFPGVTASGNPEEFHPGINGNPLRVAYERLLPVRVRHCPAACDGADRSGGSEIGNGIRGSPARASRRRSVASWFAVASAPSHGVAIPTTGKRRVRPKLARLITWRLREAERGSRRVGLDRSKLAENMVDALGLEPRTR